jgi:hypothetical protein
MIGHLLALAVPILGIVSVVIFQLPSHKPTRGDTSTTSQGSDRRDQEN